MFAAKWCGLLLIVATGLLTGECHESDCRNDSGVVVVRCVPGYSAIGRHLRLPFDLAMFLPTIPRMKRGKPGLRTWSTEFS